MVQKNLFKKLYSTASGKAALTVILIAIIAGFLLTSTGFSKILDINNKDIARIKSFLSTAKLIGNFVISDDKIRSIFNISINTAQSGADISYGLLVLSALNEFDLIDLVTSQTYKQEARDYFNKVMDERMNIIEESRKTNFKFSKIALSQIAKGTPLSVPMGALILESIAITDKTITIALELNVLRQQKLYDGLWRYFDSRRWRESHDVAWEDAMAEMSFVVGYELTKSKFLSGSGASKDSGNNNLQELALQFATLWNTWGPYTNAFGITPKAREEFDKSIGELIQEGIKKYELANIKSKLSLSDKVKLPFEALVAEIAKIREMLKNLADKFNLKLAVGSAIDALSLQQTFVQNKVLSVSEMKNQPNYELEAEPLADQIPVPVLPKQNSIEESIAMLLPKVIPQLTPSFSPSPSVSQTPSPTPSPSPSPSPSPTLTLPVYCSASQSVSAAMNKVIFNEIAWMGTVSSSNDEWFELKNISGIAVDLSGWQILDGNQDIKIIFSQGTSLEANSLMLLERTDDNSVLAMAADLIYTGSLANSNESLYLFNSNCQLEDKVLASSDWSAGDNASKRTMERKTDFNWQTSYAVGGTPKTINSAGYISSPIPSPSPEPSPYAGGSLPDNNPPNLFNLKVYPAKTAAVISWQTDEDSASRLEYWQNPISVQAVEDNVFSGSHSLFIQGLSQKTNYYFKIESIDARSNAGESQEYSFATLGELYLSEVQTGGDEFIELYNPNQESFNLSDLYLCYYSEAEDWQEPYRIWQFDSDISVPGQSHYLIGVYNFPESQGDPNSDWQLVSQSGSPYTQGQLSNNSGAIALFSFDPRKRTAQEAYISRIDALGWGGALVKESLASQASDSGQSMERTNLAQESNNNANDFYVQNKPNPTNSSGETKYYDLVAPETSLDSFPDSQTIIANADFGFSASEAGSVFECSLDSADWSLCESPQAYQNLNIGNHNFRVRAIDQAQNIDSTPASYNWEIINSLGAPILSLSNYKMTSLNFTVSWDGQGQADHFDVQVKVNDNNWQDWLTNTNQTSQNYSAEEDFSIYAFRARSINNSYSPWQEIHVPIASMPVVINEVMYDPNPGSDSYYEYIELYNPCSFDIDLQDWILISDGSITGDPQILSADVNHNGGSMIIKAKGYALVTDQSTNANNVYDGYYQAPAYSSQSIRLQIDDASLGLRNDLSQSWLTLKDKSNNIIDRFYYSKDWNLANGNGRALGKTNPLMFSNHQLNWGETEATPNQQNSNYSAQALNYLGANLQINQDTIFSPSFDPYIIDNQLTISPAVKLTIKPGTIIKFLYSSSISSRGRLIVNGRILAQGTQSLPIVFTSSRDTATDFTQPAVNNPAYYGDWNYIEINSTSQGTIFDNVIVRYGGVAIDFMQEKGAFRILGANIELKNSLFDNNRVAGIYLNNSPNSLLENLTIRNHNATYGNNNTLSAGLWLKASLPVLNNISFTNNGYGVFWQNGTCSQLTSNATLSFSQNSFNTSCAGAP